MTTGGTSRWSDAGRDGADYDERFARIAARGVDMHGEVAFVQRYNPKSVLDAGCGTGRVAIELANREVDVVGTDLDGSMLAQARRKRPDLTWVEADLSSLDLGETFDVVVLAGNVMIFLDPGTEPAAVTSAANHLEPGGLLIAGFQLNGILSLADYDAFCSQAGLELHDRFATWDADPFVAEGVNYSVSVHRKLA